MMLPSSIRGTVGDRRTDTAPQHLRSPRVLLRREFGVAAGVAGRGDPVQCLDLETQVAVEVSARIPEGLLDLRALRVRPYASIRDERMCLTVCSCDLKI